MYWNPFFFFVGSDLYVKIILGFFPKDSFTLGFFDPTEFRKIFIGRI